MSNTTALNVKVSPEIIELLDAFAVSRRWKRSEAARFILEQYLQVDVKPISQRPDAPTQPKSLWDVKI